ncbi:unnamed protein product [Discosporangium mesarthrocarpum]
MPSVKITVLGWLSMILVPVVAFAGVHSTVPTEAPKYTLYISDKCPYAQRSWIAARELGVPFDLHQMELGKDNKEEWYLNINPLGKVPAVVCGEDVVYESLVINEYLSDCFPGGDGDPAASRLLPENPGGRAMARIVAQRSNDLVRAFFTYLSNKSQKQEATLRESFEKEIRMLDEYAAKSEKEGGKGWLCGKAGGGCMTLADIAYLPFMERIDATLKPFKGWSLDELDTPALQAWMVQCMSQESVAGTLKDPSEWAELYKKFLGVEYFVRAGVTDT